VWVELGFALQKAAGEWKVFTVQAQPLPKEEWEHELPENTSGAARPYHLSYETLETRQQWSCADDCYPPDDASVLSLPDGIMPFVRLGLTEDQPALQVGVSWAIGDDLQYELCRDYDDDGFLVNVRYNTAVREGTTAAM
jgi:hypothetical protein